MKGSKIGGLERAWWKFKIRPKNLGRKSERAFLGDLDMNGRIIIWRILKNMAYCGLT